MKVASFEKLKSIWNQTWFIMIWELLHVHSAKGHIPRSKVILGQVVRCAENVKFASFKKLKIANMSICDLADESYSVCVTTSDQFVKEAGGV